VAGTYLTSGHSCIIKYLVIVVQLQLVNMSNILLIVKAQLVSSVQEMSDILFLLISMSNKKQKFLKYYNKLYDIF